MYVREIELENVGPVAYGRLDFPFTEDGHPLPVVLVGANGSGKSVVLSFVVNALLSARQTVFNDTEVEKGKVYKYRSPSYIRSGQHHYFGRVLLEKEFEVCEWQLDRTRREFEVSYPNPKDRTSWSSIPETKTSAFLTGSAARTDELKELLDHACFLFFPPNRFEALLTF